MRFNYIYLDNGATTRVDPSVVKIMQPYLEKEYGNASSSHAYGQNARIAVENSRNTLAKTLNCSPEELIFTSGGTESNNFAIKSIAFTNRKKGGHIITTKIDHDCVLNSCKWLEKQGFDVTYLGVDEEGFVDPIELNKAITEKTILVSIIHGNNEIGTIQDLEALGNICKDRGVYFHTDACQSYTKVDINLKKIPVDLVTLNAHKIHGPKGVGALFIRKSVKIEPWQHGGGHEFKLRSGTENVPGIIGFAEAGKIGCNFKHVKQMTRLRDLLIEGILKLDNVKLNGPVGDKRLCNNVNVSFRKIEGESIGAYLDSRSVASSTGSACSTKSLDPSHVLLALGLSHELANGSLRLTLSRFTTEEEIDYTLKALEKGVKKLRGISPF